MASNSGSKTSSERTASESRTKDTSATPKVTPAPAKVSAEVSGAKPASKNTSLNKAQDTDWNKSATPGGIGSAPTTRVVQTVPVSPPRPSLQSALEAKVRQDYPLGSDKLIQRAVDNGGTVPFEGVVDWGGIGGAIYDFLQAPANRRIAAEAEARQSHYSPVVDEPLSFGNMLDFIDTPEVSTHIVDPIVWPHGPSNRGRPARTVPERLPAEPLPTSVGPAPYIPDDNVVVRAYGPNAGYSEPGVAAIDGAVTDVPLPRVRPASPLDLLGPDPIVQSAEADDLFTTDGQVQTADGQIIRQGTTSMTNAPPAGIDAAAASEEPKVWDTVVDNAGKLFSNTALGGLVSTLFPDMWSAGGDMMKGLATGSPPVPMSQVPNWDSSRGTWLGNSENPNSVFDPYAALIGFIDANNNGIDDRLEGRGAVVPPTPTFDVTPTRTARFPNIPPYNPGVSDEWSYFTNNHLADGGPVAAPPLPRRSPILRPGNIDLENRQVYQADDGSYRTENSISIGTDEGEVLIPTIINGKQVSEEEAIQHYYETGENLGLFATPEDADSFAQQLHLLQEARYAPKMAMGGPVRGYADGGYADGGNIDPSDPRVKLIGETEDVLERLKAGEKPDEAAARTLKAFVAQFGDAALKALNDNVTGGMTMRRGRMIKGPGGPKDDEVPAVIVEEGTPVSPAKLSNGEFVMPVEAVEGIGGAEAMQELADRLSQRSRT